MYFAHAAAASAAANGDPASSHRFHPCKQVLGRSARKTLAGIGNADRVHHWLSRPRTGDRGLGVSQALRRTCQRNAWPGPYRHCDVLQPLLALQPCLSPAVAASAGAAAGASAAGAAEASAEGAAAGGVEPPQAVAPTMIPETAAAINALDRFIALLTFVELASVARVCARWITEPVALRDPGSSRGARSWFERRRGVVREKPYEEQL